MNLFRSIAICSFVVFILAGCGLWIASFLAAGNVGYSRGVYYPALYYRADIATYWATLFPGSIRFARERPWESNPRAAIPVRLPFAQRWEFRRSDPLGDGDLSVEEETQFVDFLGLRLSRGEATLRAAMLYYRIYYVPLWPFAVACLLIVLNVIRRQIQKRRLRSGGLCHSCRYDLRAHKLGDKCPECGTPVPAKNVTIPAKGAAHDDHRANQARSGSAAQ